ncbi:hypothetical protein [Dysosmobacter sp.]|uniref:hypothetical protein n=1 Tax=Dysosmobacter sp. TaxID=2591382 RepID=UPI002F932173
MDIYYKFIGLINQKAEGGYKGEVVKVKRTEMQENNYRHKAGWNPELCTMEADQ